MLSVARQNRRVAPFIFAATNRSVCQKGRQAVAGPSPAPLQPADTRIKPAATGS